MNREIKFRFRLKMLRESWGNYNKGDIDMFTISLLSLERHSIEKQWEVVSRDECTGLKDKNGKDIFEGDIFEVAGNKKYEVKFCEGGNSNHEWYGGAFILYFNEELFFPFDEYAMGHGIVIGNIYETPNLTGN